MDKFYINRDDDLESGNQFDVTETANKSGLMIPVFLTRNLWDQMIVPDEEALKRGENETGRIKDILSQLVIAIRVGRQTQKINRTLRFNAKCTKDGKTEDVEIFSYIGPVTGEDQNPCITLFTLKDNNIEN